MPDESNTQLLKRIERLEAVLGKLITWLPGELGEDAQKHLLDDLSDGE